MENIAQDSGYIVRVELLETRKIFSRYFKNKDDAFEYAEYEWSRIECETHVIDNLTGEILIEFEY